MDDLRLSSMFEMVNRKYIEFNNQMLIFWQKYLKIKLRQRVIRYILYGIDLILSSLRPFRHFSPRSNYKRTSMSISTLLTNY